MNESSVKVPTASQSCRSSALCRREAGAFGKEGPNFSLPRDDGLRMYGQASRRGLEQHKGYLFRNCVLSRQE